MRFILCLLSFYLFLSFPNNTYSQELRENEVVVIQGEKYVLHQVKTGETIYSITKRYEIDRSELERYNSKIGDGLSIGEVLKIPLKEGVEVNKLPSKQKRKPSGYLTHKVKSRRETAYFIARKYGISVEDLNEFNPNIKKIKKGTRLQIPYWDEEEATVNAEEVTETVDSKPEPLPENIIVHKVVSGETLYGISKKYKVTEQEILNLNPDAGNLRAGVSIRIPKKDVSGAVHSQAEKPAEIFAGKYFEHIIESGETLWGTSRKYGVSEAKLKEMNPILHSGFPAGAVIRIPVKEVEQTAVKPVNESAFKKHYVEKGQTLYGLSKLYDVSIPEIKKYNPVLDNRNLVFGETILIPEKPVIQQTEEQELAEETTEPVSEPDEDFYALEVTVEVPENCSPDETGLFTNQTYDVALFLPLFLEANDTLNREDRVIDSLDVVEIDGSEILEETLESLMEEQDTSIEVEERKELFKQFYGSSENFIQFYEGVLLAVKDIKKSGVDINLHVFDTQLKADSIRSFISRPEFLQTDLIIGPIYPRVQTEVAQIAAKNRIPIVSPLASRSDMLTRNPQYFQVNPSRDYLAVRTAEMVAEEYYNSNFIILKTRDYKGTSEGRMVELLREKFFNSGFLSQNEGVNFTFYDFKSEGAFGLRRIMSKKKENVVYIPTSDEGELSIAISNVNNLAGEYSITLIGSSRYPNYQSIQLDHYHNLKLKYVTPYWVDYSSPGTIQFIEDFKSNFGTEPNNYGRQGYDVTRYFMRVLTGYGNNFEDCLPYFHMDQIQGNYHFEKASQFGGYMNQGVSVISYTRDYDVKRQRVKGQPRLVTR